MSRNLLGPALGKHFEHAARHETSRTSHGIVGFVPLSLVYVVHNVEEIAFLERQLLGGGCAMGVQGSDDLLWRLDSRDWLGD